MVVEIFSKKANMAHGSETRHTILDSLQDHVILFWTAFRTTSYYFGQPSGPRHTILDSLQDQINIFKALLQITENSFNNK